MDFMLFIASGACSVRPSRKLFFNLCLTATLLFPALSVEAFRRAVSTAEKVQSEHSVSLPEQLGDWKRKPEKTDINDGELTTRHYLDNQNRSMFVLIRQISAYRQMHDFTDCLIANGLEPQVIGSASIDTARGTLNTTEYATHVKKEVHYSLLWFQNDLYNAADKWSWRTMMLSRSPQGLPLCRQVRVLSDDGRSDKQTLESVASLLYQVPF
ncbi:MAG: hypothetical protein ACRD3W_12535 [Terriglobales bacterium]